MFYGNRNAQVNFAENPQIISFQCRKHVSLIGTKLLFDGLTLLCLWKLWWLSSTPRITGSTSWTPFRAWSTPSSTSRTPPTDTTPSGRIHPTPGNNLYSFWVSYSMIYSGNQKIVEYMSYSMIYSGNQKIVDYMSYSLLFYSAQEFLSQTLVFNPYIFATWWCKPLIFQSKNSWSNRIHSLK